MKTTSTFCNRTQKADEIEGVDRKINCLNIAR